MNKAELDETLIDEMLLEQGLEDMKAEEYYEKELDFFRTKTNKKNEKELAKANVDSNPLKTLLVNTLLIITFSIGSYYSAQAGIAMADNLWELSQKQKSFENNGPGISYRDPRFPM